MRKFAISIILLFVFSCSQTKEKSSEATMLDKERQSVFKNLLSNKIVDDNFKTLNYFDWDSNFIVSATIELLKPEKIYFATNTDRKPEYFKVAKLNFVLNETACSLIVYATEEFNSQALFIPFKDKTNNKETYGAGRYIEMKGDLTQAKLTLDFNRAFNPYCHYNDKYSCPIVPIENKLNVSVFAGEKKLY